MLALSDLDTSYFSQMKYEDIEDMRDSGELAESLGERS
jgi:hypothetical protein